MCSASRTSVASSKKRGSSRVAAVRGWGHQAQIAYDGVSALQAARDFRPDVVLLDIGLPKLNGYEVARQLRRLPSLEGLAIFAVTGYAQEEDLQRAAEAGIERHFGKPVDLDLLCELLYAEPVSQGLR